jgi:hypothetical protein
MVDTNMLVRDRNRLLTAMAGIFVVWQGGLMARDLFAMADFAGADRWVAIADMIDLAGGLAWLGATILLVVFMRRVKRAEAQNVINDELFRQIQAQAMRFGFKAMLATLVLALVLEAFVELEAEIVIRAFLIVAVAAPLGAFVVMSGNAGEDAE